MRIKRTYDIAAINDLPPTIAPLFANSREVTREEYMALPLGDLSPEEAFRLHHAYYAQFVNDSVLHHLAPHLRFEEWTDYAYWNDKPLSWWDNLIGIHRPNSRSCTVNNPYLNRTFIRSLNGSVSASDAVCIYKAAATILYIRYLNKE